MTRKGTILTVGAAILLTGFAFAQGPRFSGTTRYGATFGNQATYAQRMGYAQQEPSELASLLVGVVADELGLTRDEFFAQRAAGVTIEELADAAGISLDDLEAAYLEARAEAIAQLLEDGVINAVQADQMTLRGSDAFDALVSRDACLGYQVTGVPLYQNRPAAAYGPGAMHWSGPGRGMMPGRPGRW